MSAPLQGALSNVVSQINPDQISNAVQSKVTEAISTITAATSNNQEIPAASQAVFEDMRSQLAQLNTTMSSQLREIANTLDKQVRATKGLSPTIG
jgi:hypothetical protein